MARDVDFLVRQLQEHIESFSEKYYKLVLIIGSFGSGKTNLLQEYHSRNPVTSAYINLNHELTKRLLDIPTHQIPLISGGYVTEIFEVYDNRVLLVDNIEALFDPVLSIDALKLLQQSSRLKMLVVAWPGLYQRGKVSYAEPGYKEYKSYFIKDLVIIDMDRGRPVEI